jgi:DNA-binding CsgD family transcriptional regulator
MNLIFWIEVSVTLLGDLLRWLGLLPRNEPLRFQLDESYDDLLQQLAELEQRPAEDVAVGLLMNALDERKRAELSLSRWRALSPREQQVAALICLNYTGRQIAARLKISPETVKTHTRNLLNKFELRTRTELRKVLADWDFSAWE